MKLRQIELLCQLADAGLSVSRAANAMHTTQPNASRQLQALEREVGASLFVRSQRRILGLTPAGTQALESARRVLREVDHLSNVRQVAPEEQSGSMTVAVSHTQARYFLPEVVRWFRQSYPRVRVVLRQGDPRQLLTRLAAGEADIAITSEASISFSKLALFSCHKSPRVIVTPQRHPLTIVERPSFADLAQYPLITYDDSFAIHARLIGNFEQHGVTPNIVLTATDVDVMKTYVRYGLGVAIVASLAFGGTEDEDLTAIPAAHLFDPSVIKIVLRKGTYVAPYVLDFIRRLSPSLTTEAILQKLDA
jgi:LysR family cys regulon transcriptional activator